MSKSTIAILGATGSIGCQALDLLSKYPERFSAIALSAHSRADLLFKQCRKYQPKAAGLVVEPGEIPSDLKHIEWFFGADCSECALRAVKPDIALCAVVGMAGLPNVLCALETSKRVLLANKEALVTGGALVMDAAKKHKVQMLPVDSEHSAIFQCLEGLGNNAPHKLILTASGGPFRTWNKSDIDNATVEDALGHPTWNMGKKITVDCATMMNKGLEVIEAHHLFNVPLSGIDVVIHPQSVIHSMVEYSDGAVIAQLGAPDMREAIGYAMGYPDRLPFGGKHLNFAEMGQLLFEAPDTNRFPCLQYAYQAQEAGGNMPVVLNGANEAAVDMFLKGRIRFGMIPNAVDHALQHVTKRKVTSVEDVFIADRNARLLATQYIETQLGERNEK